MDHLEEARNSVIAADESPLPDAHEHTPVYQSAIAHALIALVERLDAVTVIYEGLPAGIITVPHEPPTMDEDTTGMPF